MRRFASLGAIAALVACTSTEGLSDDAVLVEVETDGSLPCAQLRGTAVAVGAGYGEAEEALGNQRYSFVSTSCDPATNKIGSFQLEHTGDRLYVVVLVGYDRPTTDCRPPVYAGCIVARASLYAAGVYRAPVVVKVSAACHNVPCDALSTCVDGTCRSSIRDR